MDILTAKVIVTGLLSLGGAAMIAARRLGNHSKDAGLGIAGWICVILFFMWA